MTTDPTAALQIPRDTFASIVTARLRADIVNGALKPGTQLGEVELARNFGVSRGPVREAMQRLIQEGLLRSEPHRGVFVPVLTDEDVVDIYLAREALESAAVRSIITRDRAASTCAALDEHVSAMERAEADDDWETVSNSDLEFHTVLVANSGSQRLQRMFSTVISETRLCLAALTEVGARAALVAEHRQISEMIRAADAEQALVLLKRHFDDAIVTLTSLEHRGHPSPEPRTEEA